MSLHAITPQAITDPRTRNPRTLARELGAALHDVTAARADLRRLSSGRTIDTTRSAHRAARALAALAHAEAEADRIAQAIEASGGAVHRTRGGVHVIDRRGLTIATF